MSEFDAWTEFFDFLTKAGFPPHVLSNFLGVKLQQVYDWRAGRVCIPENIKDVIFSREIFNAFTRYNAEMDMIVEHEKCISEDILPNIKNYLNY